VIDEAMKYLGAVGVASLGTRPYLGKKHTL